jgi:hypothetical protein
MVGVDRTAWSGLCGFFGVVWTVGGSGKIEGKTARLARKHRREIPPLRGAARSQERTRKKRPRRSGRDDNCFLGRWGGDVVLVVLLGGQQRAKTWNGRVR